MVVFCRLGLGGNAQIKNNLLAYFNAIVKRTIAVASIPILSERKVTTILKAEQTGL